MASPVTWTIGVYDREGDELNSVDYNGLNNNEFLKHATDLVWTMPLNGIDTLEFSLYLDDPAAMLIERKQTVIRVWRDIDDDVHSKTLNSVTATPDFVGIVTSTIKTGSENKLKVKCMSPLWLLQAHFHIDNHRMVDDPSDYGDPSDYEGANANDLPFDHSALMFRLIDFINGAFNDSGGDTGIRRPTTASHSGTGYLTGENLYWPQTVQVAPYFVQRGSNTWANIFEDLMARSGAPDIVPQYIYVDSSKNLMYFKTAIVRGTNRFSTFSFDYRTGSKNLKDVEEQALVVPGEYGNFLWVVGDGGPNGGHVTEDSDPTDMLTNGLYMVRKDIPGTKANAAGTSLASNLLEVAKLADAEVYTIQVAPGFSCGDYFGIDYFLGDQVKLNADKGALSVTNSKQRIYSVTLQYSDTNVEDVSCLISADFKRKYVE